MELPNEAYFPLSNRYYNHCKNVFYPFPEQQLSGKHIPSSKSCNLLLETITEKMKSKREREITERERDREREGEITEKNLS